MSLEFHGALDAMFDQQAEAYYGDEPVIECEECAVQLEYAGRKCDQCLRAEAEALEDTLVAPCASKASLVA